MKDKTYLSRRILSVVQQQAFILFKHISSNDTVWALPAPSSLEVMVYFYFNQKCSNIIY